MNKEHKTLTPEQKSEYRRRCRQVDEAGSRLFDRGTGGRIPDRKPNLYNNRLKLLQEFCAQNGLTDSRYMKRTTVV